VQPDRLTPEYLLTKIQTTTDPVVYISGPEPMVKSLAAEVATMGVDQKSVKIDDFPGYEAD
jgi:ferredoxin-NADP reductase